MIDVREAITRAYHGGGPPWRTISSVSWGDPEYIDGRIVAISVGSRDHSRIAMNVGTAISRRLEDRDCRVFGSDLRVGDAATGRYTYRDVSVVGGEPKFDDEAVDILLNPTLILEVLSPSTEAYDRGDKFADYRRIPSLQEYMLIAQDQPSVEHYLPQGDQWLYTPMTDGSGPTTFPR